MGGETFCTIAKGKTPDEAFRNARAKAQHDHGHAGYTGTVAEKDGFTLIPCPADSSPRHLADDLIEKDDERISDKWGPAGCIKIDDDTWLFFGWASS